MLSDPPSGKIRSIRPADRRGARVRLELVDSAGEIHTFELASAVAHGASLRPGAEVDGERLRALQRENDGHAAREAALRLLSHRARTRAELVRRLRDKGFDAGVVEDSIQRLDDVGLIDDAEYARLHVRDRIRLRPRGRRALLAELRAKGVAEPVARAAVDEVVAAEEVGEIDLAREAARRWRPGGKDRVRDLRRLHAFLARRGFGRETAEVVAREILGEDE